MSIQQPDITLARIIMAQVIAIIVFSSTGMVFGSSLARAGNAPAPVQQSNSGMATTHPVGEATRGEELYNASCVVCHGARATGGIGPRLADNPVLANHQAFWKMLSEGRHMMPPLKDALTEQQLADIHAWLKSLR